MRSLPSKGGRPPPEVGVEFTGHVSGVAIHGVAAVTCAVDSVSTTGTVRVALATVARWNAVNSGVLRVMNSIQHSFLSDQAEINAINQRQQQFNQNVQQFDNVLNGVQDVQDPTTGTIYEAPYDSYDPTAPMARLLP